MAVPVLRYDEIEAEILGELGMMQDEQSKINFVIKELGASVKQTEDSEIKCHVYSKWLFTQHPTTSAKWRQQYSRLEELETIIDRVARKQNEANRRIDGINKIWTGWNWTFPADSTPPHWPNGLLKSLRTLAGVEKDWRYATKEVAKASRVRRRTKGGRKTAHVSTEDVAAVIRKLREPESEPELVPELVPEPSPSIEQGRGEPLRKRRKTGEEEEDGGEGQGGGEEREEGEQEEAGAVPTRRRRLTEYNGESVFGGVGRNSIVMDVLGQTAACEEKLAEQAEDGVSEELRQIARGQLDEHRAFQGRLMAFLDRGAPDFWF
ncbi:hypothetical protein AC578_4362 [Pseudocercospora eumusae]|uniref:Uncharacterized protein n=1 Tax=Pseudocercospora eumusae TaxID=321146 RepID=A0A139H5Y8_9PEZI|nr:hypothetical protein AC578_4362 [Pseudocercospora eumusae]